MRLHVACRICTSRDFHKEQDPYPATLQPNSQRQDSNPGSSLLRAPLWLDCFAICFASLNVTMYILTLACMSFNMVLTGQGLWTVKAFTRLEKYVIAPIVKLITEAAASYFANGVCV